MALELEKLYIDNIDEIGAGALGPDEVLFINGAGTLVTGDPSFTYDNSTGELSIVKGGTLNPTISIKGTDGDYAVYFGDGSTATDSEIGFLGLYDNNTPKVYFTADGNPSYVLDPLFVGASTMSPPTLTFGVTGNSKLDGTLDVAAVGDTAQIVATKDDTVNTIGVEALTLEVNNTATAAGSKLDMFAGNFIVTHTGDALAGGFGRGVNMDVQMNGENSAGTIADVTGLKNVTQFGGTGLGGEEYTVTQVNAQHLRGVMGGFSARTHTISKWYQIYSEVATATGGSFPDFDVNEFAHIYLEPVTPSNGTRTDAYGIYVGAMSYATNNYGIYLAGDGIGSGIVFGIGKDDKIYHDETYLFADCATGFKTDKGRVLGTDRYTSNQTLTKANHYVFGDTDGGAFTITLDGSPVDGQIYRIYNVGSSGNNLTIGRNGNNIYGVASDITVTDGNYVDLVYETTEAWW